MDKDFLLESSLAQKLYFDFAKSKPILDYHSHINPSEIYENKRFNNLTEAWLGADHYKWRLMRSCGIEEDYITGNASPWEKFKAFAQVLPRAAGNPVYHWAHLELQRFFDCKTPLCSDTARDIWELTSERLRTDENLTPRGIIKHMNVEALVTTDDPADTLEWHQKLAADSSFDVTVLPCWRPDAVFSIEADGFSGYISKLGDIVGSKIKSFDELKAALQGRLEYFNKNGCKAADHGVGNLVYAPASENEIAAVFRKALGGECITTDEADKFRFYLLCFLAGEYTRLGWVMELHLGVLRNINNIMYKKLGANTGFDAINPQSAVCDLALVLDALNTKGALPKTLIFSANPNDNAAINTIANSFNEVGIKSKVQQGSAWWFNDTLDGMENQLISFAEYGVLSNFIGMLTDSRSFLSYVRHEYFRRILCNQLGRLALGGKYPDDALFLGSIVEDICYNNVKEYFGF